MPDYLASEASNFGGEFCTETSVEVSLLSKNWKFLLSGIAFQYLHGLAAHGVHYFHRPGPTLQDVGFFFLPELGADKAYISEMLFTVIFFSFALWTLNPFFFKSKRIYTVLNWVRVLAYLAVSQSLRIVTFFATQLPGPNYHCRVGSELATLPPPKSAMEVLLLNYPHGVNYGCGDLILSSRMIFTLVFVPSYHKNGGKRCIKQIAWLLVVIQSLLIIASRTHYTVDIVIAWYVVNLVVVFVDHKLSELPDRCPGSTTPPILPLITRDKDSRNEDELHRFINGNSVDIMNEAVENIVSFTLTELYLI